MKQLNTLLTLSALVLTMLSCKKEEVSQPQQAGIQFSINIAQETKSTSESKTANPSAVVISAEDAYGNPVYKNESIAIELTDNAYRTKTIQFEPGTYKLTKFMVTDADGNALNATPMGYSSSAAFVNDPLPVRFSVQKGFVTLVSPAVLSTLNKNPEQFGYTSFSVNQNGTFQFQMGVYIYNSSTNQFELTNSSVSITSSTGETVNQNLQATIDSITVKDADKYVMSVSKDGYQTWTDTLTSTDLLHFYKNPFAISLDKLGESAFGFVSKQDSLSTVSFSIAGTDRTTPLRINWGDGNLEVLATNNRFTHTYTIPGTYTVHLTGNISSITNLVMTSCQIAAINLDQATGIKSIDVSRNQYIQSLNLSSMHHLKEVYCVEGSLESLILPHTDSIESVYCSVNHLTNLDVSSLAQLKNLYCDRNNLTSLDISQNVNLRVMYCYNNALTSLGFTNNGALQTLDCRNNQLTSIDVSKSLNLQNLVLTGNSLSNDGANNLLVTLLNNVKLNPRSGKVSISVSVRDGGKTAKEDLENQYQWTVSTN